MTAQEAASERAAAPDVLIRADNGDVITFDETGLTLRLSDSVLADLRARLATSMPQDPAEILGDIDAWGLRTEAGWHRFTAALEPGRYPRDYQCPVAGGDIIAHAPGALCAIFSLGGARRAGFNDVPTAFPYHVLAPADDVFAVGMEGSGKAGQTGGLQRIPHATRDALIAETLLARRSAAGRGLPLILVRAETDGSVTLEELRRGQAYANFRVALDNLVAAAQSLGRRARVLSVGIDHSLEDLCSPPSVIAAELRALMAQIERDLLLRGLPRPVFIATFEAGTRTISDHAAIRAHWELAWSHGSHVFAFSAPGYMFEQTRFGRPTGAARIRMAEMDAHALDALSSRSAWQCPLLLLAEADGRQIRVTAQALCDLVLDRDDPLGAGPLAGFSLAGTSARVVAVDLAPDDPQALILTCDRPPDAGAELRYALGAPASADAFPANRGALRDLWSGPSRAGGPLHRWALPAALPVQRGAA